MQSDPTDCTTDYYTSNEIIKGESSPVEVCAIDEDHKIKDEKTTSSQNASQIEHEAKQSQSNKRHKNDILDDFFALGEPNMKKKKKKSKKSKHSHKDITHADSITQSTLNINQLTNSNSTDQPPGLEKIKPPRSLNSDRKEESSPNRMGSVTPPPAFDKEALFAKRMELEKLSESNSFDIEEEEDEEEDDDLEFLKQASYRRLHNPNTASESDNKAYQFTDQNERKRVYKLKVTSKLIPGKDSSSTFGTKGTKRFSRILDWIISHFLKVQKDAKYTSDEVSLIWVDGKMEVKPFFKPSTLRVQPDVPDEFSKYSELPPTNLNCLLIPKSNLDNFINIYPEFEKSASSLRKITDLADEMEQVREQEYDDVSILEPSDGENTNVLSEPVVIDLDEEEDNDNYFVIGLKGKDNKRTEVQVSRSTHICKLLSFYLKTKGIQESDINMKTVKLIFDDEELNLNGVIGDTELEEDFEVQIVI